MEEEYVKPGDVARRFGVSRQAVYKWIKEGRLKAVRFGAEKAVRIPRSALEEFERKAGATDRMASDQEGKSDYNPPNTEAPGRAAQLVLAPA